ncbi:MAG: ParB/RepB/Spo0J family partition protein [Candidatus Liptonbacteria bacterium]|nr:ParB/RepB/Spo0J family partition protein [Candidatus Liptonbacteria bacterium]
MKIPLPPGYSAIIRIDLIDRDTKQPRKYFAPVPLQKLAANIAVSGVFHAIYIRPNPEKPGRYLVVAGERRFRSLQALEVEEYEFRIVEKGLPPYIISIIENSHRENLNSIEEAESYEEFMKQEGTSVTELCAYNGKHPNDIYRALRLLKLAPEVQQLIREGKLNKGRLQDLAQYKILSKQIELAQQLVRGEDPPELVEADTQTSKWRDNRILALLPTTPEGLISRMLQFRGRAYPAGFVLEAFLKLSETEQVRGWTSFTRITRENFVTQMCAFADKLNALNKKMVVLPETQKAPFGRPFQKTKPSVTAQAPPASKPQDDKKKAVESKPPKAPVTMTTYRVPSSVIAGEPTSRRLPTQGFFRKPPPEPELPPEKPKLKLTSLHFIAGKGVLDFISEAVEKKSGVLLSKSALGKAVGNGSSAEEAQKMVLAGFRAVREVWRSPLQLGDPPEKQGFVEFVANCRHDLGDMQFHDFIRTLKWRDRSADPINVDAL